MSLAEERKRLYRAIAGGVVSFDMRGEVNRSLSAEHCKQMMQRIDEINRLLGIPKGF